MVHRQAVTGEDLFEYPLERFGRGAYFAEERRDLVYLSAVDLYQLPDVRQGLVVRGDEYFCFKPLQHVERFKEFSHVVDKNDVVFRDDLGAEERVGEETGAVVGLYPDHIEVVAGEFYYLQPPGQRVFNVYSAFRRFRQQEFIAQLRVWVSSIEERTLLLRVPREGVFYIGGEDAAARPALDELVAADVVGVRVGVDDAGDPPPLFRDFFEYFAPRLFIVAGIDETDITAAERVDAYIRGIFYIPALFAGLNKFVHPLRLRLT